MRPERHTPDKTDHHRATSYMPEAALLTTACLWASTFIVTKDQLEVFSPFSFIFVRFVLMVALAFTVMAVRSKPGDKLLPAKADLPRFVLAGLTGYTFYQIGFVNSLDRTSAFSSSLLIATVPLWTLVILSIIGERPASVAWVGVATAIGGVSIFLLDRSGTGRNISGDLLAIGAAISFATYGIINRPLATRYTHVAYSAYTLLLGSIPLLIISLPAASDQQWSAVGATSWLAVIYMVIFPVYVAYILWNFGIAHRGAALASSFGLLPPVLAGVLSALIFNEQFGPLKIAGGALVLVGLILIRRGNLESASKVR